MSHRVSGHRHTSQPLTPKRCPLEHGNHHIFIALEAHSHCATLRHSYSVTATDNYHCHLGADTATQMTDTDMVTLGQSEAHCYSATITVPKAVRQSPESRQPKPVTYLRTLSLRRP